MKKFQLYYKNFKIHYFSKNFDKYIYQNQNEEIKINPDDEIKNEKILLEKRKKKFKVIIIR